MAEARLVAFVKANRVMVGTADEIGFAVPAIRGAGQSENVFIMIRHVIILDHIESKKSEFDYPHGHGAPLFGLGIQQLRVLAATLACGWSLRLVGTGSILIGHPAGGVLADACKGRSNASRTGEGSQSANPRSIVWFTKDVAVAKSVLCNPSDSANSPMRTRSLI